MRRIALALLHHPVLDRQGEIVTTAITNLDLHDMARSARTYGVGDLFVVHPIAAQRMLAQRIKDHWVEGSGKNRIPDRAAALDVLRIVTSFDEALDAMGGRANVEVWTTAAKGTDTKTFADARAVLEREGKPVVIVFGTGWGLARSILDDADVRLEPIRARADVGWNHLSVRAACAITLDRLLG